LLLGGAASGRFYLQRHELRQSIHLPVTDQVTAADAETSVQRPALADHHITRPERSGDGAQVPWRDLGGLTRPAGADVVPPQPGGAAAVREQDLLLGEVFVSASAGRVRR
jgi:hypothetical protein